MFFVFPVTFSVIYNISGLNVSHMSAESPKQHKQVKLEIARLHSVIFNFIIPCCAMKCVESSRLK